MNDNSSLNTGLLFAIVILLILGGFWFFSARQTPEEENAPGIEITLPENDDSSDNGQQQ